MGERRGRVVSVRLTGTEHAAWTAGQRAAGRATLAGWARSVVGGLVEDGPAGGRPGAVRGAGDVSAQTVGRVAEVCQALNTAVRAAHIEGRPQASTLAALERAAAVCAEGSMTPAHRGAGVIEPAHVLARVEAREPRPHLVNVRATAGEVEAWSVAAALDGRSRVSGWVRAVVSGAVGVVVPPEPGRVPPGVAQVRREIGGALTNAAQVAGLVEDEPEAVRERVEAARTQLGAAFVSVSGGGA